MRGREGMSDQEDFPWECGMNKDVSVASSGGDFSPTWAEICMVETVGRYIHMCW